MSIIYIYSVYIYIYISYITYIYKLYKFTAHSIHPHPLQKTQPSPGRGVDGIPEETKARQLLSDDARVDLPRVDAHLELLLQESDGMGSGEISHLNGKITGM